jgi:Cro/C1-type HTH DNA-binding domain
VEEAMIVSSKREEYDGSFRLVLYETDSAGKCVPKYTKSDFDEQIDTYYTQRATEFDRLKTALFKGEISPIGFFLEYYHMNLKDLAARIQLRPGKVKKHLTPKGFASVNVATLQKYARIFDTNVADFFSFTFIPDGLSIESARYHDRLLQEITILSENE